MNTEFIYKSPRNTHRLIIIFAGWSTVPDFYRDLHADGWDIAVVWDYTSLELDAAFMDDYSTVFVLGWSLGVAAATHAVLHSIPKGKVSAAFAVNGTPLPCHDDYGIPAAIYEATGATLNARNLLKFTKRMGYNPPPPSSYDDKREVRIPDFDELAKELAVMRRADSSGRLPWKRVYISSGDRIFPPENMERFWSSHPSGPQIVSLDAPHYVHLQRIIDEITPNFEKIGRRFCRALPTYDSNASAQHQIVECLVGMLSPATVKMWKRNCRLLEIGSGSGMFTRKLGDLLHPASATFIDLYPVPEFHIAPEENYVAADAEEWINTYVGPRFDLIASASTIQWFADPENFFRQAARNLSPDGLLLVSSFLPGNLTELDASRPSPLLYRSESELREMLSRHFRHVEIHSCPIVLTFPTRRALLRHLHLTGVGGGLTSASQSSSAAPTSSPSISAAISSTSESPSPTPFTLTYLPVYILASDPCLRHV